MPNDYALFLLHLPNDFDSNVSTTNLTQREDTSSSSTDGDVHLRPTSRSMPIMASSSTKALSDNAHEHAIPSSSKSLCVLLSHYFTKNPQIDPIWTLSHNKKIYQITFYVEFGLASDQILQDLVKMGIGKRSETKISVLPTTIIFEGRLRDRNDSISFVSSSESLNHSNDPSLSNDFNPEDVPFSHRIRKRISESKFKKSVRARLMVHQVVASIRASTELSFDFVVLICLASMLAAFGLLESSTVVIVASMLVSPLMNPILGVVFGLSIREHSLWRRGLRNELIGLIICLSCGFTIGLLTTHAETKWGSSTSFPTSEMKSRGDVKRLWVGILIALPSGAGVALSVLGGNTGSLVGVAISASLLPPAVNSGLLFAYSILASSFAHIGAVNGSSTNKTLSLNQSTEHCPSFIDNTYLPLYRCNLADEAAILGACSLLLTIVNIICIIIMALLILRIKEVVPLHQTNKEISDFFHHDVKVARDYNKTIHESDLEPSHFSMSFRRKHLTQSIISQWKKYTLSDARSDATTSNNAQGKTIGGNLEEVTENPPETMVNIDFDERRKVIRLRSFAKEYELDLLEKRDYELLDRGSEEKVRLLVNDLIDVSEEMPSVCVDLTRLQPGTTQTSNDEEYRHVYQELIEALPPKWYQLYKEAQERREKCAAWSPTSVTAAATVNSRSYSLRYPTINSKKEKNQLSASSSDKTPAHSKNVLQRLNSAPDAPLHSSQADPPASIPIRGTRFHLTKLSSDGEILSDEIETF